MARGYETAWSDKRSRDVTNAYDQIERRAV
jgi:hypothetical protein